MVDLKFIWDPKKAKSNLKKHGVSFEEATTVFGDPLSITVHDPVHSGPEERFVSLGMSHRLNTLVVVHADRGESIRIISARRATRSERNRYGEGIEG